MSCTITKHFILPESSTSCPFFSGLTWVTGPVEGTTTNACSGKDFNISATTVGGNSRLNVVGTVTPGAIGPIDCHLGFTIDAGGDKAYASFKFERIHGSLIDVIPFTANGVIYSGGFYVTHQGYDGSFGPTNPPGVICATFTIPVIADTDVIKATIECRAGPSIQSNSSYILGSIG